MIKNFRRRLVYKDFKLTLLSNIQYVEILSCSINLKCAYLELPYAFYLYYVHHKNAILTNNNQNLAK